MQIRNSLGICLLLLGFLIVSVANSEQNQLPKEVSLVTENAKNVIDLLLKKDWGGAQPLVESIVQNESRIEQEMQQNHFPPSVTYQYYYLVYRLQELLNDEKQPIQTALVANQIIAMMINLEALYAHLAPVQIAEMDYLGREIVLEAQVPNDYGLLKKRISQLEQTWNILRPSILDRNGKNVADQIDPIITDLKKEPPNAQTVDDGNHILALVDKLENLFK
jgi:hypothetical protein